MVTSEQSRDILGEIDAALDGLEGRAPALHAAASALSRRLPHVRSVAVYLFDRGVLNLETYAGHAPEHTLIAVGQGVPGRAAAEERDISTDTEAAALIRHPDAAAGTAGILTATGTLDESDGVLLASVGERLAPRLLGPPE
jgi:putative methionine-R-sulfoxide reductase with GAF domain